MGMGVAERTLADTLSLLNADRLVQIAQGTAWSFAARSVFAECAELQESAKESGTEIISPLISSKEHGRLFL
jgi:hypothetical protein